MLHKNFVPPNGFILYSCVVYLFVVHRRVEGQILWRLEGL